MQTPNRLRCDGCGQFAAPEHIARRLQRLEWSTRYRPIHVQALLLGGIAPRNSAEFLYTPEGSWSGEAEKILHAVPLATEGKPRETVLAEFQRLGLMLVYLMECPLEPGISEADSFALMQEHLPKVATRIRRSLKPKRVVLISEELRELSGTLREAQLGCPILPASQGAFLSTSASEEREFEAFRLALAGGQEK